MAKKMPKVKERPVDCLITRDGGLFLFELRTDDARTWVESFVEEDAPWFAGQLVVEHMRYATDIAEGMQRDGLRLQ